MAVRQLTTKALNRALLARQLLLQRARLPVDEALQRVAGLQTQYAPSGYIGLWSRLVDLPRDTLTRALEQGQVVQATLMRSTIHMVSATDFPLFAAGVRRTRQTWWLGQQRGALDAADMDSVADLIRGCLAGGPARAKDLQAAVEAAGYPKAAWQGAGLWVDLVRMPPSGTWERRRADLYGLAEQWVRSADVDEPSGLSHLLVRYLGGFGPASLRDAANWAGVALPALQETAERLTLRRFTDADGQELVDVPRAPLPDPTTPAPVRFLPTWDATLLAHARRANILPEEFRKHIFSTKIPQSVPTFLVDGSVAGTWRFEDGRVSVAPFEPLPARVQRQVDDEAQAMTAFHS